VKKELAPQLVARLKEDNVDVFYLVPA